MERTKIVAVTRRGDREITRDLDLAPGEYWERLEITLRNGRTFTVKALAETLNVDPEGDVLAHDPPVLAVIPFGRGIKIAGLDPEGV